MPLSDCEIEILKVLLNVIIEIFSVKHVTHQNGCILAEVCNFSVTK